MSLFQIVQLAIGVLCKTSYTPAGATISQSTHESFGSTSGTGKGTAIVLTKHKKPHTHDVEHIQRSQECYQELLDYDLLTMPVWHGHFDDLAQVPFVGKWEFV